MQFNTTNGHLMKRELTNVRLRVIYNSISVYIMTQFVFVEKTWSLRKPLSCRKGGGLWCLTSLSTIL